jgi:branched-chain amino acid transport system ATP-binding protein
VRQGEIVALLGANGAGKTSTLGAIMGLVRSSARAILFDGHDVRRAEPERRVRLGMTLTPEGRQIFSELTIEENLRLGRAALGRHRANKDGDDAELLDLFPILRERRGRLAGTLSGGQQQQLAIARSLMSHPRLLLLDEPSLGLAPVVVDTVFDLITTLAGRGITILLVEQNVTLALSVASRGYVLDTGRLVLSGTSAELMALEDEMMRSYLGLGMTSAQGSTR